MYFNYYFDHTTKTYHKQSYSLSHKQRERRAHHQTPHTYKRLLNMNLIVLTRYYNAVYYTHRAVDEQLSHPIRETFVSTRSVNIWEGWWHKTKIEHRKIMSHPHFHTQTSPTLITLIFKCKIFLPIKFLSVFIPFDRMQFIPSHTIITQ